MNAINISKFIIAIVLIVIGAAVMSATAQSVGNSPELPAICSALEQDRAPIFHVYAIGVQIYQWNGTSWELVGPDAKLYAEAGYHGEVGKHYAGPTWESNSGSKIVARKTADCTPDTSAVAWLLLEKVTTTGPGIFGKAAFVQRVKTTGGVKPAIAGSVVGEEKRIPYTAEYYFYRSSNQEN
jgi:hypothetical protein